MHQRHAIDGVTIVEGHEYAETITDQNPAGGWIDSTGYENGDKCAWVGVGGTGGGVALASMIQGLEDTARKQLNDVVTEEDRRELHADATLITSESPAREIAHLLRVRCVRVQQPRRRHDGV